MSQKMATVLSSSTPVSINAKKVSSQNDTGIFRGLHESFIAQCTL